MFLNNGAGVGELALEPADADGQRGHLLVQVVMQLAGNVSALFLLRGDQPSGKVFYTGIAFAQSLLVLAQSLLGRLALGYVNDQAAHFQASPAFVVNGLAASFHPAHTPVRPDDAILAEVFSLLFNRFSYRSRRDRKVIRVHPVGPGEIVLRFYAKWVQSHDRIMLFGPLKVIGFQIPLPGPHTPSFEREPQTLFALAPFLLDLFAFSDITPDGLKFDDVSACVQDRMVNPLLPADSTVGQQHLVLIYLHARAFD